jgi:hypothetical protein
MWGKNAVCGLQCALGPATSFRSVGASLRLGPRGKEAVRFRDGLWLSRKTGGRFQCLWTEIPSLVRLEDPLARQSITLGTFDMIGIFGNTIYAERENSRAVATLDEKTGLWRTPHDNRNWPELTLQAAINLSDWPAEILAQLPASTLSFPETVAR